MFKLILALLLATSCVFPSLAFAEDDQEEIEFEDDASTDEKNLDEEVFGEDSAGKVENELDSEFAEFEDGKGPAKPSPTPISKAAEVAAPTPAPSTAENGNEGFDEALETGAPVVEETIEKAAPKTPPVVKATKKARSTVENLYYGSDSEYERHFHDVNTEYHLAPTLSEEWNRVLGERKIENYNVQLRDTLWGISEMLFADGNYWPKVWSLNPSIANPHIIEIGQQIRFEMENSQQPPLLTFESKSVMTSQKGDTVYIPPPTQKYRPALKQPPASLPMVDESFQGEQALGFAGKKLGKILSTEVYLPSYIAEEFPPTVGTVREMEGLRTRAAVNDYIYIEVPGGKPGASYTVISSQSQSVAGEVLELKQGVIVDYLGEVELVKLVNPEENLFRAKVRKAINPVVVGALLVPGVIPRAQISMSGRKHEVQGNVIGGEFNPGRLALGVGSTLYLDVGTGSGVQKGDLLSVLANEILRNEDTDIAEYDRSIGYVKVVRAENAVSTAVVVYSSGEISVGDLIGRARPALQ